MNIVVAVNIISIVHVMTSVSSLFMYFIPVFLDALHKQLVVCLYGTSP